MVCTSRSPRTRLRGNITKGASCRPRSPMNTWWLAFVVLLPSLAIRGRLFLMRREMCYAFWWGDSKGKTMPMSHTSRKCSMIVRWYRGDWCGWRPHCALGRGLVIRARSMGRLNRFLFAVQSRMGVAIRLNSKIPETVFHSIFGSVIHIAKQYSCWCHDVSLIP